MKALLITLVFLTATASGCGGDVTEVLVVTDSDLTVPTQLDALETTVMGPGGDTQRSMADLTGQPLPRTLSLVHETGALGLFNVSVSGRVGGAVVVSRQASFSFVPGETRVLVMHLTAACRTMACGGAQTCTENGCRDVDVPESALGEWTGSPPTLEGGPVDSGMPDTGPADTSCGAGETSCGGACVDTDRSDMHCGMCNNSCRGMSSCSDGECG